MNCPKCSCNLNTYDKNDNLVVGYQVYFYGGDRTKDGKYCAACAISEQEALLYQLTQAQAKALHMAKSLAVDLGGAP